MSKIISAGNPILKNVAAPVEVFDKKLKFLVIDMKKTLYEANGVGFLLLRRLRCLKGCLLLMTVNPALKLTSIRNGAPSGMRRIPT